MTQPGREGMARDKVGVKKPRSGTDNGDVTEVAASARAPHANAVTRATRSSTRTQQGSANQESASAAKKLDLPKYKTKVKVNTVDPEPDDVVARVARKSKDVSFTSMSLNNRAGQSCVVTARDLVTIADGQCLTDAIIGAVRASDEVDMRSRLAQYQVEVYGLRRELVIWGAAVTALGNAMGYSRDQMLAAAAYVVKTDGGAYRSIEPGGSPSTPPHLPTERTGGPLPAEPCGAQSCAIGGFVAHTELGVIHQHPRPLPPLSRASPAHDSPGGPKTPTNGNGEVGPGVRATTEVLLDMPAAKRGEKRPRVDGGSLAAEGTTAAGGGGGSGGSSQYTGVRREKKRGTWSAKILVREPGKARRTQMRLGSYTQEPEAAYAYAAAAHVLRPGVVIPRTIQLTPTEQSLLAGCSKKVIKLLVKSRMWFRWREWEQAVLDCHGNMDIPETETPTGSAEGGGGDEVEEEGGQDADVGTDDGQADTEPVKHTAAVGVYGLESDAQNGVPGEEGVPGEDDLVGTQFGEFDLASLGLIRATLSEHQPLVYTFGFESMLDHSAGGVHGISNMETSDASIEPQPASRSQRVSKPPSYLRNAYQLTQKRQRGRKAERSVAVPAKRARVTKAKGVPLNATASAAPETSVAEAPQAEVEISVGAGDEDIESESEARPAPSRSKNLASVMAESQATATTRPRPPPVRVPDNPFVAMPVAGSSRDPTAPGEETHILISRAEFEALKKAQEASARTVARLEEELRSAKAVQARAPPRRPDEHVSGSGGASGRKRKRREELADEETSDEESEDEPPTKRGHLRVSKSPVLQRALNFLPANKSWKRACDLVKDYLFFEKENARITFYPSSDDKTVGVCAVIERLPFDFATLALAADKARRSDLNKALSEWKSGAAGRTRDISCPRMGLFRDERDTRSPWATKKDRTLEEIRSHYGLLLGVDDPLALSKFGNDREGMPFASGAFVACAVAAFKPKKVVGPLTVKLYHLAWLEHVVTDTLVNWEARKGRLSNSACGNAQVVDGLVILAREAVSNAIRIFKPKYDVASCSWTWGRHGLRLSSCGLEDLIPATAATRDGAEVQADEISGSLGGP
ncbi:unnamed protein product [Closterium sp. Yama58-4]|nr:unnamed protein product [Closterium sp. Yama58-4]